MADSTAKKQTTRSAEADDRALDLRRFFRTVKKLRWVYVASLVFFLGLAITYCIVKFPQYEVKATLLIEDPAGERGISGAGGMATMMRTFSVGGFGGSSVINELQRINSHAVRIITARALGLNRNYVMRDGLSKQMLFLDSPIAVEAPQEMMDTLTKAMKIRVYVNEKGKADISVTRGMFGTVIGEATGATLPATVETPFGPLTVLKTAHFGNGPFTVDVSLGSYESAADYLFSEITTDTPDKLADAVSFEMLYPNRERGRAILNTIMAEYNAKRLNRKHATARTQLEFLDGRIAAIFGELTEAEQKIKDFKAKNNIVNIEAEAPLLLESALTAQSDMVKATAEVAYYKEILAALTSPSRRDELLPVFDSNAYPMIKDYNDLIIAKKELERSAKPSNPVLQNAEANLAEMRASVTRNIESMLQSSQALLRSQSALASKADSRLNTLPAAERDYVMLERDRELKNELYAYLASQRESAMLQLYNDETLGFIVDEAYTSIKPSKKKALMAVVGCLFMAIFCPTCLALWLTWRNRRITEPMDTASLGIEEATRVLDGSKGSVNALRTLIMERARQAVLYVSGPEADTVIKAVAESFGAIDRPTAMLSPADMGLPADNDSLLLPAFQTRIADIAADGLTAAVMVSVPDADRVSELVPVIADNPAASLLLAYRSGKLTIPALANIEKAIPATDILLAIVK